MYSVNWGYLKLDLFGYHQHHAKEYIHGASLKYFFCVCVPNRNNEEENLYVGFEKKKGILGSKVKNAIREIN